jgi:hypothetical protein
VQVPPTQLCAFLRTWRLEMDCPWTPPQGGSICYVNSILAREAGRLYGWKEKFWGRRYKAIVVNNEEEAQIDRLEYILSNSVKEGLVERPQDWPGAHRQEAFLPFFPS